MNQGQTVFAQIVQFLSHNEFGRCVERYDGNRRVRRLSCWEQFLAMAFANSRIARACETSKSVWGRSTASCITRGFAVR
jgi:hypothetical protein